MRVCVIIAGLSEERAALASYVLRTLLATLGLPHEVLASPPEGLADRVAVWYGPAAPPAGAAALVEIPCQETMTAEEAIRVHAALTAEGRQVRLDVDLVSAAGLWLTGGDEGPECRDASGRCRGAATARSEANLLRTPVVTDLMNVLWAALSGAASAAGLTLERVPAWPDGRKFAVFLSHDVDLWRKRTARQFAKELLRGPWRLGQIARAFCRGPDPWSDLDAIADLEERRGMHSTFFVLAGRPDLVADGVRVVNSYQARPEEVRATLRRLAARGWEVGLHGSFGSFRSAEALAAERRDVEALCGEPVLGCRQHFLRFERPATWRAQAEAGLHYDATLGYHDTDGYRAGFSFPFSPPVHGGERGGGDFLPLLELPLVVMDGALLERQGLDAEAAWRRLACHLERTEADGAMLGLLWHNTHFCDLDAPGYRGVYERALDWIREHGGWGASGREISEWWRSRSAGLGDLKPVP